MGAQFLTVWGGEMLSLGEVEENENISGFPDFSVVFIPRMLLFKQNTMFFFFAHTPFFFVKSSHFFSTLEFVMILLGKNISCSVASLIILSYSKE